MTAAKPAGEGPPIAAAIVGDVRRGAVARRAAISPAVLHSRHQQVANQRRGADCDSECRHFACHGFLTAVSQDTARLCAAKAPQDAHYGSPKVAPSFIYHSTEMWTFDLQ